MSALTSAPRRAGSPSTGIRRGEAAAGWLFTAPVLVILGVFLLVPVAALVALLALEARLHRGRSLAGAAGVPAAFDRPELHGKSRGRVT